MTVFQRTPQYSVPANNYLYSSKFSQDVKENFDKMRKEMHYSKNGLPINPPERSALEDSPEERQKVYEKAWNKGGVLYLSAAYNDLTTNEKSNETISGFLRKKIVEKVNDPNLAKKLEPTYYFSTKRPITDTNYFETLNQDSTTFVDVKESPIKEIKPWGVSTKDFNYKLDTLVFATGYDAMTGSLFKIDIRGKNGMTLKEKWDDGAQTKTNLGLATVGFSNFFIITGPESPSVVTNVPVAIEQHVEWTSNCIQYLEENNIKVIEAKKEAEEAWSKHCNDVANDTLYVKTSSWYRGSNIDGKPEGFPIYLGSITSYRDTLDQVAANNYEGFSLLSNSEKNSRNK